MTILDLNHDYLVANFFPQIFGQLPSTVLTANGIIGSTLDTAFYTRLTDMFLTQCGNKEIANFAALILNNYTYDSTNHEYTYTEGTYLTSTTGYTSLANMIYQIHGFNWTKRLTTLQGTINELQRSVTSSSNAYGYDDGSTAHPVSTGTSTEVNPSSQLSAVRQSIQLRAESELYRILNDISSSICLSVY